MGAALDYAVGLRRPEIPRFGDSVESIRPLSGNAVDRGTPLPTRRDCLAGCEKVVNIL